MNSPKSQENPPPQVKVQGPATVSKARHPHSTLTSHFTIMTASFLPAHSQAPTPLFLVLSNHHTPQTPNATQARLPSTALSPSSQLEA